jgi:hypothetical protein
VVSATPEMERAWAVDAAGRIATDAPRKTGSLASSIEPGQKGGKGIVSGNYYGVILDRGTKSYGIAPKKAGGTLHFTYRGRTIFAKKVTRKRLRRRPFATKGAQDALRSSAIASVIVKAYSRKRGRGRGSALAL